MPRTVLVLDVGTSSLKAVLFTREGEIAGSAEAAYAPGPRQHRQDAEAWWSAVREAIAKLGADRIEAISLTGAMENLIPVDEAGRALCYAILYSDPCGSDALAAARGALGALGAAEIVGNEPEPLMTAFKIGWLRDANPEISKRAAFLLPGAKDVIAMRLTGGAVTDPATATTTGLMNLGERSWSRPVAEALDIPLRMMPEILPANAIIGPVSPAVVADLGLASDREILVVNGCGDAGATTLGSFCEAPGDISLYLGTTGWLARVVDAVGAERGRPVYRLAHPSSGLLIEITPILAAGAASAWAREALSLSDATAEDALAAADKEPADILFLPYLSGERFPFMDTQVRGAFLGLGAEHNAATLYYAVPEGFGFAIRANLDAIDPGGDGRIRFVGGGTKSTVWAQMLADILGRPIAIPESASFATCMGAFIVAAEAFGLPRPQARLSRTIIPRPERQTRAKRLAAAFTEATAFARGLRLRD